MELLGLQSRPRTAASFARSLRSALKRMAIDSCGLRVRVVSVRKVLLAVFGALGGSTPRESLREDVVVEQDGDTRVVWLH